MWLQFVWQHVFIAPLMSADTLNPNVLYAPRHEAIGRPVRKSMKFTVTMDSSSKNIYPIFYHKQFLTVVLQSAHLYAYH